MDPNGLDISEQSSWAVLLTLYSALALHPQRIGVLCRLYALPYCTPAAPPVTYEPAPASSQYAVVASGHANAPPDATRARYHVAALCKPRLYDSARPCRSSPALAGFATASRDARSHTSTTK